MQYQVLGALSARSAGEAVGLGGPRQRLVVALLLLDPGAAVSIDRLIDGVWGESPPEKARHTIQAYVSELRGTVEDSIEWTGHGYRIGVEPDRVDAKHFERLASEGRGLLDSDPGEACALLKEGLDLWKGEPFADLAYAEILQGEIRRLKQLRIAAVEDWIDGELALGSHRSVVEDLEGLTREHPLRERLAGQLMLALYRSGRQAEAVRAFGKTRRILAEELGLEPSRGLQGLYEQILEQDPGLLISAEPTEERFPGLIRGFELREVIGEGTLGVVHRAYQSTVGREVAIKKLRPEIADEPEFIRSFEADAQAIAGLEHPHILSVFDFWRDQTGTYLVMPWMEGGNLLEALKDGPLSLPAAMKLIDEVGSGLSYAHRRGVIHGSLTPENVLRDADGNAYLSDFIGRGARSPEEEPGHPATPVGDVFQLGALAQTLLTGRRPPSGRSRVRLTDIRDDVAAPVDAAIERAMAPDPQLRFSRVDDFLRELRRSAGMDVVAAASRGPAVSPVRNPYKGLRAFQELDADDFFGREDALEGLLDAVREHPLVAVVGPSGSGKSSLVKAGLVPALRSGAIDGSERWVITDMFPGAYPFEELVTALSRAAVGPPAGLFDDLTSDEQGLLRVVRRVLPDDGGRLVLLIDQFEEMFSMVTDPETRRLFLESLVVAATDGARRVQVLITLRADFYDRPLEFHRLGELTKAGLVSVAALSPDGLARAVSGPARSAGLDLEPGLVAEVVRDVEGQPGGLPLFQHALGELFEQREGSLLTVEGYRRTGGVLRALGRRAEELFLSLTALEQSAAEQIFLRLVTVGESSEDTRRRVRKSELADLDVIPARLDTILQRFGGHRLLSFDRDPVTRGATVEVAHEALLREWDRLSGWVDDRRDDLVIRRRLQSAMREWEASGRESEFFLTGGRLDLYETWVTETSLTITGPEKDFIVSSRAQDDDRRSRARRRRRAVVAALAGAALVATSLFGVATVQRNRAVVGERTAGLRELISSARVAIDADPDLALLLAAEAVEASEGIGGDVSYEATALIHQVLLETPEVEVLEGGGRVAWSPRGDIMITHEQNPLGSVSYVWDAVTFERLGSLIGPGDATGVAFSADGAYIATSHLNARAAVWDADTLDRVAFFGTSPYGHQFPHLSPDGSYLILSHLTEDLGRPVSLTVWDVESGEQVHELDFTETEGTFLTALSPDGALLAVTEPVTGMVRVFETDTWTEAYSIEDRGVSLAFSPDGDRLAMGGPPIRIYDSTNGALIVQLDVAGEPALRMTWSPNGDKIAIVGPTREIRVVDVSTGETTVTLQGRQAGLETPAFSPDGRFLATTANVEGEQLITEVWDLREGSSGVEVMTYYADHDGAITHAAWTHDSTRVIGSPLFRGDITVFDAVTGAFETTFSIGDSAVNDAWARAVTSSDGRYIAASRSLKDEEGRPGTTQIIDPRSLEVITTLEPGGHPGAFSADSSLLIVGDFGAGYVYEVGSWRLIGTLIEPDTGAALFVDGHFLSDGRHLITAEGGSRPGATIWDMETWSVVGTVPLGLGPTSISATTDGSLISVGVVSAKARVFREADLLADPAVEVSPIMEIEGLDQGLFAHLSPDGSTLVTGGLDEGITFWDVATGQSLYRVDIGSIVSGVEFSLDGRHLLVAADFGVIRGLTLDSVELAELARGRAIRDLTDEECRFYLHVDVCP